MRNFRLTNSAVPDIRRGQLFRDQFRVPGENFQRFGALYRRNQRDDGANDASSFAGGLVTAGRVGKNAAQTGGLPGQHRHTNAVAADGRAVNPGDAVLDREIVQEIAGLEIVGAIQ